MKIAYLGTGSWGFCLASHLASKGYKVVSWALKPELVRVLNETRQHPLFPGYHAPENLSFTSSLSEALDGAQVIVESVTAAGIRPVFEEVKKIIQPTCPIILTSKGIEQNTGYMLSEIIAEILGKDSYRLIGLLSGPSYAQEVIKNLPTSVVGSAYEHEVMMTTCDLFTTKNFRVYPNSDIRGVSYAGSLKNIIGIACGIADGMKFGFSTRAALMTRGLHEIRKLAVARGGKSETVYGLAGMGDLCVTCSSVLSRNFRFGQLLAQGMKKDQAFEEIGMVVEGAYTCVTALQLSHVTHIPMPITEIVNKIIYENLKASDAVAFLMQRAIKEEHL